MCKARAIARPPLFGSDRIGGNDTNREWQAFDSARRSRKRRGRTRQATWGPQMNCGRGSERPPRPPDTHRAERDTQRCQARHDHARLQRGERTAERALSSSAIDSPDARTSPRDHPPREARPPTGLTASVRVLSSAEARSPENSLTLSAFRRGERMGDGDRVVAVTLVMLPPPSTPRRSLQTLTGTRTSPAPIRLRVSADRGVCFSDLASEGGGMRRMTHEPRGSGRFERPARRRLLLTARGRHLR